LFREHDLGLPQGHLLCRAGGSDDPGAGRDRQAVASRGTGHIPARFRLPFFPTRPPTQVTLFIIRRLIQSAFVLLAVSVVGFFAVYAVGNPVELLVNPNASYAERQVMIHRLGLDLPIWRQYLTFLGNMLHGDLGTSFVFGTPTIDLIFQRMPATLEIVVLS